MYTRIPNSSVRVKYAIVHVTKGRIRIRIPRLKYDREYQCSLEKLVDSLEFVSGVRINPLARSIIIHYDERALTFVSLQKKLATAIQQAANIDLLMSASVQSTPSLQNGTSREKFSLEKNISSNFNTTNSKFCKSKEISTELDLIANKTRGYKPPTMARVEEFKTANIQLVQKPVVENSGNSLKSNGFSASPQFLTTDKKTSSSIPSTNTDKRFRIIFLQTRAIASPLRSSKQEKIVDYNRMSQQLQTIHRAGGKILSISVIL